MTVSILEVEEAYNVSAGHFIKKYRNFKAEEVRSVVLCTLWKCLDSWNQEKSTFKSWVLQKSHRAMQEYFRDVDPVSRTFRTKIKKGEIRERKQVNLEFDKTSGRSLNNDKDAENLFRYLIMDLTEKNQKISRVYWAGDNNLEMIGKMIGVTPSMVSRIINNEILPHFRKRLKLLCS